MSEENFYLKNYFIKDENGRTKEEAKRHKEILEELFVDRPEFISDGCDGSDNYLDFIFWACLILLIALLIWGRFFYR
jgi:hypothetical protein